jgi:hypothetical protein
MEDNLIIDESNFDKYFRNTRNSKKQKNDIIVMFSSSAVFSKGKLKEDIIDLLFYNFNSVNKCLGKLFKFAYASHSEGVKLCKDIMKDYINGMTKENIIDKEYPFVLQMFFYTKYKYVPMNDRRWMVISDEFGKNSSNFTALQRNI